MSLRKKLKSKIAEKHGDGSADALVREMLSKAKLWTAREAEKAAFQKEMESTGSTNTVLCADCANADRRGACQIMSGWPGGGKAHFCPFFAAGEGPRVELPEDPGAPEYRAKPPTRD